MKRRYPLAACLGLAIATTTTACALPHSSSSSTKSCDPAPAQAITTITKAARTSFQLGDSKFDGIEIDKFASVILPPSLASFGADRVLSVLLIPFFADNSPNVYGTEFMVTNSNGSVVYPLGDDAAKMFDLPVPSSPTWKSWSKKVIDSTQGVQAYYCVTPNTGY